MKYTLHSWEKKTSTLQTEILLTVLIDPNVDSDVVSSEHDEEQCSIMCNDTSDHHLH